MGSVTQILKIRKKFLLWAILLFMVFPSISFAAPGTFKALMTLFINKVFAPFIPVLVILGLIVFIWGVIKYMTADEDTKKRQEGTRFMIWGIVGLFVMVSVWGLVNILTGTFQLENTTIPFPNLN